MNYLQFAVDNMRREFGLKRATVIDTPTGPAVFLTNAGIQHCQSIEQADALADAVNRFDAKRPLTVCDGWTEPRHPRVVIKDGDPGRISHGMCGDCQARLHAEMDK